MPPHPVWFDGRDAVLRFLAARAFSAPGNVAMVPTTANAQPAVADYRRNADGVLTAHALHVLTAHGGGIAAITVFLEPQRVRDVRFVADEVAASNVRIYTPRAACRGQTRTVERLQPVFVHGLGVLVVVGEWGKSEGVFDGAQQTVVIVMVVGDEMALLHTGVHRPR